MSSTEYQGPIFEPTGTVGEVVATHIAAKMRHEAYEKKIAPERRKFIAKQQCNWPNDYGGYFRRDSRVEPDTTPLTPKERFVRLQAAYLSMAQWLKKAKDNAPRVKFIRTRVLGKPTPIPVAHWPAFAAKRDAARAAA